MLTGKDEHGIKLPLSLKSFGDYKPAMYSYLTIPFIKIFGLNNLSLRMVSALSGIVTALMVYLILGFFVKNEKLRLFALLLALMQPWSLHFSRVALETNLSASFYSLGIQPSPQSLLSPPF
jgi:4-amino-4-deoxy-L-arabinose transferase-like glycosyltransferase